MAISFPPGLDLRFSTGLRITDHSLGNPEDLSGYLVPDGSSVSYSHYADIQHNCHLRLGTELPWGRYLLNPYCRVDDIENGTSETFSLGYFMMSTPSVTIGRTPTVFGVDGYSIVSFLDYPMSRSIKFSEGDSVYTIIGDFLDHNYPSFSSLVEYTDRVLPTDRIYPIDGSNTGLKILNEIALGSGYSKLFSDREGRLVAKQYVEPERLFPVRDIDVDSSRSDVVDLFVSESDLWHLPNKWVFVLDDPDFPTVPVEGNGLYTVSNLGDGPSSILSRGFTHPTVVKVPAMSHTDLVTKADYIVRQTKTVAHNINLKVAPIPVFWHDDTVVFSSEANRRFNRRMLVTEWSLPLDGQNMSLTISEI